MRTIKIRHLLRGVRQVPREYVKAKARADSFQSGARRGQLLAEAKGILKTAKELGIV